MKFKIIENKGQTDKKLMVDVINNFNTVTIDGNNYVLHHLSGKKSTPRDRVTSNMLLIPESEIQSGDSIHLSLHKLARDYMNFQQSCKELEEVKWLYIGTGNKLIPISVEEVIQRLVKGQQN